MITVTVEDVLRNLLPEEYYQAAHCLYIVRDGSRVLYVGKAERQSTHERLLQHMAAEPESDFYGRVSGPSELGKFIVANAPQSHQWQIDLLTLADCRPFAKSNNRRISIAQAERLLIQMHSPLLNRTNNSERPTPPDEGAQPQDNTRALPEYSADYLQSISANRKTQSTYQSALLRFQHYAEDEGLTPLSVPFHPYKMDKEVLARFFVWLKKRGGYKNNSIRNSLTVVKQYLLWLQDENKLPAGLQVDEMKRLLDRKAGPHMQTVPPERRQADKAVVRLLDYYEEVLLRTPLPDTPRGRRQRLAYLRNHAILQTLYSTAGRASEVASLTRAQVEHGQVQLEQSADQSAKKQLTPIEISGKGGRRRLVFLTPKALKAIQAYLAERAGWESDLLSSRSSASKCDALFTRHDRDDCPTPISTKTVWQIVQEAALAVFGCDAAGHPLKNFGPQDFRHLRAQNLYDGGMPLDTIQSLLGHTSLVTTRKVYAERTSLERLTRELEQYGRDPNEVS